MIFPQSGKQHNIKENVDERWCDGLHPGDGTDHQSAGEGHSRDPVLPSQETREEDADDPERDETDRVGTFRQHTLV